MSLPPPRTMRVLSARGQSLPPMDSHVLAPVHGFRSGCAVRDWPRALLCSQDDEKDDRALLDRICDLHVCAVPVGTVSGLSSLMDGALLALLAGVQADERDACNNVNGQA